MSSRSSWLTHVKRSRAWLPVARVYQRSGFKAKVYSGFDLRIQTLPQDDVLALAGRSDRVPLAPPAFTPPIPADAGPMPAEDTAFFSRFLAALAPARVFEFGTNW